MTHKEQIKAFIEDKSGNLSAVSAQSLVLKFPDESFLEIYWGARVSDGSRPTAVEIWGGRQNKRVLSEEEIDAMPITTSLVLHPAASNLVLVRPNACPRNGR